MKALVLTLAALAATGEAKPSKEIAAAGLAAKERKLGGSKLQQYFAEKEAGHGSFITDVDLTPKTARQLMTAALGETKVMAGPSACKLSNDKHAYDGSKDCFLVPNKLHGKEGKRPKHDSGAQLEKQTIPAEHPFRFVVRSGRRASSFLALLFPHLPSPFRLLLCYRFAVKGPASSESSATLRLSLHEGEIESVTAVPRPLRDEKTGAEKAPLQAASIRTDEDEDEITISLPYIPKSSTQDWEIVITAKASSPSASSDSLALSGLKDDAHHHFQAYSAEQKRISIDAMDREQEDAESSDGMLAGASSEAAAVVVSVEYTVTTLKEHNKEHGHGRKLQTPTPTALGDGLTVESYVPSQSWQYYSFYQPLPLSERIDIEVTSLSGDADLYVTLDGQLPTRL
jgi:hypothetical protein